MSFLNFVPILRFDLRVRAVGRPTAAGVERALPPPENGKVKNVVVSSIPLSSLCREHRSLVGPGKTHLRGQGGTRDWRRMGSQKLEGVDKVLGAIQSKSHHQTAR